MDFSSQSSATIKAALLKALEKYTGKGSQTTITDIYLQPKLDTGELFVLNDDDEVLAEVEVKDWSAIPEGFHAFAESALRNVLVGIQETGKLDNLSLMKPYSFVLVDEDKETIAELLLVDDSETMFIKDELLKGLDEELNAFLKDLLEI